MTDDVDPFKRIAEAVESAQALDIEGEDDAAALDDGEPPQPPEDDGASSETLAACAKLEQNDTDNGQRLLAHFGPELLNVREVGLHVWTGSHWAREGGDEAAIRFAQRTAKRIHLEADFLTRTFAEQKAMADAEGAEAKPEAERADEDKRLVRAAAEAREALKKRRVGRRKFAISSGNAARIAAMIGQALPHKTVAPDALDADPMLFAVENSTLRFSRALDPEIPDPDPKAKRWVLQVDELPHAREHLITKIAPVVYDPEATAPRWLAFMERFQPVEPVRRFLQVYHGLALTGLVGEQCFVFNHGHGANGKSTFMEAMAELMGPYADLLNAESLTGQGQRRGDQATPDIADTPGVRYLRISELPRGEPLKESLVKSLTGGEEIKARHLNKGFFKFRPVFKAAMSGNDLPAIGGVDHGIWRRIRLVPWTVTIPDDERRPMSEILAEFAEERAGILNWLLEGLDIYIREGLRAPPEVLDATAAYREEMDPLQGFINDCVTRTEPGLHCAETARTMYEAFVSWCMANSVRPWKETAFGRAMPLKGFARTSERVRRYLDVVLHDVPDRPEPHAPRSPLGGDDGR